MAQQPPPEYSYAPPPNELPYYTALFAAADTASAGYLSGPSAVEFLSLSKLPVELLKQIWTMADRGASNTLDPPRFHVAVRLIQLFQNGKKPVDLALNLGEGEGAGIRPPFFEGVNVQQLMQQHQQQGQGGQAPPPQQQPPPPQQQQPPPQQQPPQLASPQQSPQLGALNGQRSTALAVQDPYAVTPGELARYAGLFPSYAQPDDPSDPRSPRFVHGTAAVELFSKSGMDRESLKTVWTLVDDPVDNKLDSLEFSVAMHLIVCLTKKGLPMPAGSLPGSLARTVREMRDSERGDGVGGGAAAGAGGMPGGPPPAAGGMGAPQGMQQPGGMGMAPAPGGMPSPDEMPGMGGAGMMQQQPPLTMNGGMMPQPQPPLGQPQTGGMPPPYQSPPQMGGTPQPPSQMGGMPPQLPVPSQMGFQQPGSFVDTAAVGGHTVDDAFSGLSNDPVPSVDEYTTIGADAPDGGMGSGMSTIGGGLGSDWSAAGGMGGGMTAMAGLGGLGGGQQMPILEVASPESVTPTVHPEAALPPLSLHNHNQQQQQQQAQQAQLAAQQQLLQKAQQQLAAQQQQLAAQPAPPTPVRAAARGAPDSSSAELLQLRDAHQKLSAEVIGLRAKASLVSEEERETQEEIARLAGDIGRLSLELSELKERVMESKVKLSESVGVLKVQMEKKESLEAQVAEARETSTALTSAAETVASANDLAVAQEARAVAAAAKAAAEVPPPPPVETADLFSWSPPPAQQQQQLPLAAAPAAAEEGMGLWGAEAPSQPQPQPQPQLSPIQQEPDDATSAWGTSNDDDTTRGSREFEAASAAGAAHHPHHQGEAAPVPIGYAPPTSQLEVRNSEGSSNSYGGGFQGIPDPMDRAGLGIGEDMFGAPLGGRPGDGGSTVWRGKSLGMAGGAPPPLMTNHTSAMDAEVAAGLEFEAQVIEADGHSVVPHSHHSTQQQQQPPPGPPSPSNEELISLKTETIKAEKSFHSSLSLVRSISTEVTKLESVAKNAEVTMKSMEGKKKKGGFGGKKKAKKEYEKALEIASAEKAKVNEAKQQLAAAEREANNAKQRMEEYRKKYEQLEMDAATAASYTTLQRRGSSSSTIGTGQGGSGDPSPMGGGGGYADPFGMASPVPPSTPSGVNPYGMGAMGGGDGGGGGDYDNPFAM